MAREAVQPASGADLTLTLILSGLILMALLKLLGVSITHAFRRGGLLPVIRCLLAGFVWGHPDLLGCYETGA